MTEISYTPATAVKLPESIIAWKEGKGFREWANNNMPYLQTYINDMLSQVLLDAAKQEEAILIDCLTQHLGRIPTIEDFKECEMVHIPDIGIFSYFFCHKGVKLGHMEKGEMKMGADNDMDFTANKVTVRQEMIFHPHTPE